MLTILAESVQGKKLRNFRFHRWNSSNNSPDTATKTFWQVRTLQKKFSFIEFLKMKLFFDDLPLVEYACLIDAPGVLADELFVATIVAKRIVQDQEILLQRLNIIQKIEGRRPWNKNLYFTLSGVVSFEMQECRQAIRKANKYSGYVRNSSAVGSKSSKSIHIPEPETPEWNQTKRIDYLQFLTVGELTQGTPGEIFFTLKMDQKSETVIRKTT